MSSTTTGSSRSAASCFRSAIHCRTSGWTIPFSRARASGSAKATAGVQVALVEKGARPGSKNVMGGILYNHYLERVVGEDWRQAPLERPIIEEQRWMMTEDAAIRLLGYKNLRNREHPHSHSVL